MPSDDDIRLFMAEDRRKVEGNNYYCQRCNHQCNANRCICPNGCKLTRGGSLVGYCYDCSNTMGLPKTVKDTCEICNSENWGYRNTEDVIITHNLVI